MVSITCPCTECEYNGKQMKCRAKQIHLGWRNMATINEGRVDMWICDHYKPSEWYIEVGKKIIEHIEEMKGGKE